VRDETISISLVKKDWELVVFALQKEGHSILKDSINAYEAGSWDYAEQLFNRGASLLAVSDDIEFFLPE
jgi:hypothetical protein